MKKGYAWIIAATIMFVVLLAHGFGRFSYPVLLPFMRDNLGLTYTEVGLIGTGNFLGYLSMALAGGFIAARFGARQVIFASLVIMGVSLFLTGAARSFFGAFTLRLITGMGNAAAYIPAMALSTAWFSSGQRGLAAGIGAVGVGLGLTITGYLFPLFLNRFGGEGWRYAWYAMGILVFAGSFAAFGLLRDRPDGDHFEGTASGAPKDPEKAEKRTVLAVWRDVAGNREVWKLGCVYFMFGFSYIIYMTYCIAYFTKELGLSPSKAGGIFAVIGFFSLASGVIWGRISDLLGRRLGAALSYCTIVVAYLLLMWSKDLFILYVSASIFGLVLSSIPVVITAAVGDAVGPRLAPAGLGLATVFFGVGQACGSGVGGWIKDATGAFVGAFVVATAVTVIGAGLSLVMKEDRRAFRA